MATARKAKVDPFLTLDMRDAGTVPFANVDEVLAWLDAERKYWQWAMTSNHSEIGIANTERRDVHFSNLNAAINDFQRFKANPADNGIRESGKSHLQNYVASGLASASPRAKYIASLRRDNDHMAHAALAAYLGEVLLKNDSGVPPPYRHIVRQGRVAMTLFDLGVDPKAADAARQAIEEVAADNKQVTMDLLATNRVALEELRAATQTSTEEAAKLLAEHAVKVGAALQDFTTTQEQIKKRLDDAHAQYTTAMEIQAPVEYWRKKHEDHKTAAAKRGFALGAYGVLGTLALTGLFYYAYNHAYDLAVSGENKFNHLVLLISGAVLAVTTVAFWTGRLLQKLYISERHMALDAKQRVTMAKTFLALASNQKVDEKDRALVLAPLFRPSSDGLISEDREPDGVAAMIAKQLAK